MHNFTEDQLQNSHLEESQIMVGNNSSIFHQSTASRIFNEEDMHQDSHLESMELATHSKVNEPENDEISRAIEDY